MAVMEKDLKVIPQQGQIKQARQVGKQMWFYIDKDAKGDPAARGHAVAMAVRLRTLGIGPRRAAVMFKRDPGSNGVQRYFDAARGYASKLLSHEEILGNPIAHCADLVRQRELEKGLVKKPRVPRITKAVRKYKRLQAMIQECEKMFNVKVMLRMWSTGRAWPREEEVKLT